MRPDFSNPDAEIEEHEPYYERVPASAMETACRFRNGSLYCVNNPCPNENHRKRRDG